MFSRFGAHAKLSSGLWIVSYSSIFVVSALTPNYPPASGALLGPTKVSSFRRSRQTILRPKSLFTF